MSENSSGAGFGLTISQILTKLLDGIGTGLTVESEVGVGSTFSFNIQNYEGFVSERLVHSLSIQQFDQSMQIDSSMEREGVPPIEYMLR